MKFVILLAALVGITYVRAQLCECTAFFSSHRGEEDKVYDILSTNITTCENQEDTCLKYCCKESTVLTHFGNLTSMMQEGISAAALICKNFKRDIQHGQVGSYYRVCNGTWNHIVNANDTVCCQNGTNVVC